jgi:hypothetical protein
MSDQIGRIAVPSVAPAATFPLVTDYAHGRSRKRQAITHTFGAANAKIEQRFHYGDPATRYFFHRQSLGNADRKRLRDFFESVKGPNVPFYYDAPNESGSTTQRVVCFDATPLTLEALTNAICSVGLTFVEVPTVGPAYTVSATVTRFPSATLATALEAQVQEIIPLIRIRVLDTAVPDIFLSDRRVTIADQLYLPRLLRMNEPGSDAILTQSIDGSTDDVTLTFGNADRVMVQLANDTQLRWARVELSLFHVDDAAAMTGTVLQLWAGYVIDWHSDTGPEFTIKASDILSALTLSSPVGSISRTCWRRYKKDGCPATGAIDTEHFPDADANSCDLGYNTTNGCMAHQATRSYGATYCSPQTVVLRSGGVGFSFPGFLPVAGGILGTILGSVSTWYPRTSIIADSIFGGTLPEIWHNDDGVPQYGLPVACKIAAGRDEDQFYIALGIVGRGPLGAFTAPQMWTSYGATHPDTFLGSTLDGQPNHGFQVDSNGNLKSGAKPRYGLRQTLGADPAGAADYFSLGRVATIAAGWFTQSSDGSLMLEVIDGESAYNQVYSAGVALCEIRRTKASSEALSSPGQHTLIAMVSEGLTGWTWSAPGSRTPAPGCVNSYWVAINTYLRAIGIAEADAVAQEEYFDAAAAVAASEIADRSVAKIIGTGTEPQFRFKGVITDRKPTRDWLQSILNSACGYYTWSFGKLKAGCRSNASVVSAYTAGNILFRSLQLTPVTPKFEKLTVQFSDQEYQFQSNTVDYVDQDLAARNGRIQNPLSSQFAVSGCPTKSQAARIALVRAREEAGGVDQVEQDAARVASWKSTILALDTEPGAVVSITDDDVPGGTMKFRVQSMRVNKDWSVDLVGKTVTASMYDETVGPVPADVQPAPVPTEPTRDSDVPAAPSFGANPVSDSPPGFLELVGLAFTDATNTSTITSGTFTIYYVDDAQVAARLASDITADATTMSVDAWGLIGAGSLVEIGGEIVLVGTITGTLAAITRAQKTSPASAGGAAAAHASGAAIHLVRSIARNESFPAGFFDGIGTASVNPKLIDWTLDIPLPNTRVLAAELVVVNAYGSSPAGAANWTNNTNRGLVIGGLAGTAGVLEGYVLATIDGAGNVTPDLSKGLNQEVLLTRNVGIVAPANSPGPTTWTLILVQDATGGRTVAFDAGYVGAAALPAMLNTTADTYSSLDFVIRSDGKCALSNIVTGVPTT